MRFKDDISEEVKKHRLDRLAELHKRQVAEQLTGLIGNKLEVLFEGKNKRGQLKGRTRCWRKVICEGPDSLVGELGMVEIVSFHHETMIGNLVPAGVLCS